MHKPSKISKWITKTHSCARSGDIDSLLLSLLYRVSRGTGGGSRVSCGKSESAIGKLDKTGGSWTSGMDASHPIGAVSSGNHSWCDRSSCRRPSRRRGRSNHRPDESDPGCGKGRGGRLLLRLMANKLSSRYKGLTGP